MTAPDQPRISLLGTTAILFEAPGTFDLPHQRRIWALAAMASKWPGIREAIPGITNLMLTFETPPRAIDSLVSALSDGWDAAQELATEGREIELPVTYGGEIGSSLQTVADHTGLSIDDVVSIHAAPSTPCSRWEAIPDIAISAAWTRKLPYPGARRRCSTARAARCRSAAHRPACRRHRGPVAGMRSGIRHGRSSIHRGPRPPRSHRETPSGSRSIG